jgi:hypothetical protein
MYFSNQVSALPPFTTSVEEYFELYSLKMMAKDTLIQRSQAWPEMGTNHSISWSFVGVIATTMLEI